MADFVQKAVNKTAVRDLAVPIATVTSFNTLIESVITDNPFGCVGYTGSDGQLVAGSHPERRGRPERSRPLQHYSRFTAKFRHRMRRSNGRGRRRI